MKKSYSYPVFQFMLRACSAFIFLNLIFISYDAPAQADTVKLRQVEIISSREKMFAAGGKITEVDSIAKLKAQAGNLGDLL